MKEESRNRVAEDKGDFQARYVVATLGGDGNAGADWVEAGSADDEKEAISMASELYEAGGYDRVSVRKMFFDEKKRRPVTIDVHMLGGRKLSLSVLHLLVLSLFGGIASFLLTYFIITLSS